MISELYKGHVLRRPDSGGKAGKGKNKTSSVQVLFNNRIIKNIRYKVKEVTGFSSAWFRAQRFVDNKSKNKKKIKEHHFLIH